jgi:RNA-directed DNA polymerase
MSTRAALYQIADVDHLKRAWKSINRRNLRSRGLDDVTIQDFKAVLDDNLRQISLDLKAKKYVFQKLRPHAMEKPGSVQKRPLRIATVRDRVVMKAIAEYIAPSFQRFDLPCSFAYVKGGGVGAAVARIKQLVEQNYKIYLQADIIKFFDSVDKNLLWDRFAKRVRQKSLLPLIRQCFDLEVGDIDSLKTEDQELFLGTESGIPQGGCLSPMLANFYLFEFDKSLTDAGFNLVRYADDFVVMCESGERAESAYNLCTNVLCGLGLQIHSLGSSKTRIGNFPKDGLDFLGLHFEGKDVFPAEKSRGRFKTKILETLRPHTGVNLLKTLQKLKNLIIGWGKYYQCACGRDFRGTRQIHPELGTHLPQGVGHYLDRQKMAQAEEIPRHSVTHRDA